MVDIKRVTASIKKPTLYSNPVTTSVTGEAINIDPTSSAPSLYSIDPFALFTRNEGNTRLEVRIPFTRFYRLKAALSPVNFASSSTTVDRFSGSKPLLGCTESLKIKRISNNTTTEINTNTYTQDGSGYVLFTPNNTTQPSSPTYVKSYTVTPAIVEGIVQLLAGDVLYFEHNRTFSKQSNSNLYSLDGSVSLVEPGQLIYNNFTGAYEYTLYQGSVITNNSSVTVTSSNPYSTNLSFFFEISELTDL